MHFLALAADFDGTLATQGKVEEATALALRRLRSTGRRLILLTGRELPDLMQFFPEFQFLFDCVVAENGALLYWPKTREERLLADPLPERFVESLRASRIQPLREGRVIVATKRPNETTILRGLREMNLDLTVNFNKDSVLVLPAGVNKWHGLKSALRVLTIPRERVIGIGDAENDLSYLEMCGCSVTVGNALGAIKESVDLVTRSEDGMGVTELIDQVLRDDLAEFRRIRETQGQKPPAIREY